MRNEVESTLLVRVTKGALMAGEDLMSLIGELEGIIDTSKSSFVGGGQKKVVEVDAVYEILDLMRENYPEEIRSARRTIKERDEMLAAAEVEANRIINDAKEQALIIAGEQEIARLAQQRADEILEQARELERETRFGAEDYADQVFSHLEENLNKLSSSVTRCRERLNAGSGGNTVNW